MKRIYPLLLILLAPIAYLTLTSGLTSSTGSPGGKTGSPGDGGTTCTQCHAGTVNTASGWINSNIPVTGYIPGQTYTITASGSHAGAGRFGFEVTAEDNTGTKTGSFVITNSVETQLTNNNKAITHKLAGSTPSAGAKSWSFDWTAPSGSTGDVTFYGAFNAANGNGGTSGDVIYTSQLTVSPSTVGIGNQGLSRGFNVFPNPASEFVNVLNLDGNDLNFKLFSLAGTLILEKQLSDNDKIMLSDIPKGMYIMRMDDGTDRFTGTLVKN